MKRKPRHPSTTNDPNYQNLVAIVSKARKDADLNQQEIADYVGLVQAHISQIEKFRRRVDILELLKIIDAITNGNKAKAKVIWQQIQDEYYKSKKRS